MRRRLLLLTTELRPAGAERIVYELATRLDPARWEVLVCSLLSPGGDDGAVAAELEAAGIDVQPLRFGSKLDARAATRLLFTLRTFKPDVLHAHLFHANLAARLLGRLGRAQRVVSTVHIVERRPLRLRRLLERLTARRDHATVCVSEAVARHARADLRVPARQVRVIPNGIDLSRFAQLPGKAEARAALGLSPDRPLVGAVGRLSEQKGFADLIDAFALLADRGADADLAIAGTGELEGELRELTRLRGLDDRVRFLGFREDVPAVLAALDVFCMPSRWEGFGLSLAEAMAAGVPAVASDVDSLPEVLGDAGVLVPPANPAALAAGLRGLLADADARADLSRRARDRAARFGVQRMVDDYARLYAELA